MYSLCVPISTIHLVALQVQACNSPQTHRRAPTQPKTHTHPPSIRPAHAQTFISQDKFGLQFKLQFSPVMQTYTLYNSIALKSLSVLLRGLWAYSEHSSARTSQSTFENGSALFTHATHTPKHKQKPNHPPIPPLPPTVTSLV